MEVRGFAWLGTRTERFDAMVAFAQDVLGMPAPQRVPGMAVFTLPDGSTFEVFAPKHPGGGHPQGTVVAGFRVDDPASAREELIAAGCDVGELQQGETMQWAYFQAPDGGWYEIYGP